MTAKSIFSLVAACAAALAGPSLVHAQQAADEPDIVVAGQKQEIRAEIKNLLGTDGGQLARFESEFCPKVIGFDPEWTPIVENMIRDNVVGVGFEVETKPCKPTAVVIFTYKPQDLVVGLRKRMPGLFAGIVPTQLDRLTAEAKGAYSWRAIAMMHRDGTPLDPVGAINGEPSTAKLVRNAAQSRLVKSVRFDIVNSYLVLDLERTPGMSLNQIAAFATMHLLLDLSEQAPDVSRTNSILKLFEGERPENLPASLGGFDRLLLEGLYTQAANNVTANQQRGRIAQHIKDASEGK